MELEVHQVELLESFCLLAKSARGRSAAQLISQATSEPGLFAFGELLEAPHIKELGGTEHETALELLKLFSHGTWADYKAEPEKYPPLQPLQELKLKQLTVITLAETSKVIAYDALMQHLEISNVRQLEDLLINDCMYAGIVRGKLDQKRRCLEVHFAAGRDLRPGQLSSMIEILESWLHTSESLLSTIQEKIKWADDQSASHARHQKEVEDTAEEVKKKLKAELDLRGQADAMYGEGGAAAMDFMEDGAPNRPKRRR